MKLSIMSCVVVCLAVVGCASHPYRENVHNPSSGAMGEPKWTDAEKRGDPKPCDKATDKDCKDNFDAVGAAAATGSRYIYDESKKAWRFLTSDDLKKSVAETEARLKSYVECAERVEKALMDDTPPATKTDPKEDDIK